MSNIALSSFKGINNKANETRLPDGYLRECVDFVINNSGVLTQREGYTLKISGEFTALWSDGLRCFAVRNGDLIEVFPDYTAKVLRANAGRVSLDFCECDGDYYFVGNAITGVIRGDSVQQFGQDMVIEQPRVAVIDGGALQAGTYLIAVTTLDGFGKESGTVEPVSVVVTEDNSALQLSGFSLPSDSGSPHFAIYLSDTNGNALYRQGIIAINTQTVILTDVDNSTLMLDSFGMLPAPFGRCIAYHYGHLFIASGNVLYYSDTMAYHRWNPANNYTYPSEITAIMSCETGLWIGTRSSGLFWISGKTPSHGREASGDFSQTHKHSACVFQGSEKRVEADAISQTTYGWMITAQEGLFLLLDQGQFFNVSQDNIRLPIARECTGAIMRNNDSINYLAILHGAGIPQRSI